MIKFKIPFFCLAVVCAVMISSSIVLSQEKQVPNSDEISPRLKAVKTFADKALKYGRDRWSGQDTPLFADGLNIETLRPAVWRFNGNEYFISNFASQQNFLRTLVALSLLTGDDAYENAARDAVSYMFNHKQHNSGLLPWGGHRFVDLKNLQDVTGFDSNSHELKRHFPYFKLMFEVDPDAATRMVRAMWESHIFEWSDMFYHSRHGPWINSVPDNVWDRPFNDPEPHQIADRVGAMVHTSNDLMFAAVHAFEHVQEEGALLWATRKGNMWYKARNPETGLGSYYYHMEPTHYPGTDDPRGFEWPEFEHYGMAATSTRLWARSLWPRVVYVDAPIAKFAMAELLGEEDGEIFRYWAHSALKAFATHDAYNEHNNTINLLLTDGRVVSPENATAAIDYFYSFSMGYRITGDGDIWHVARGVANGYNLGNIGENPGDTPSLNLSTNSTNPVALLAFLELYRALEHEDYLQMARNISDNILREKINYGFLVQSKNHVHVRFDDIEPFALLMLEAVEQGKSHMMPVYPHGDAYIHGSFDGEDRTYDTRVIWPASIDRIVGAPQPHSPVNVTGVSLSPELIWFNYSISTTGYQVQIADGNHSNATILVDTTVSQINSFKFTGELEPSTSYFWRVRSFRDEYESNWSNFSAFITESDAPQVASLVHPANNAGDVSLTPDFEWSSSSNANSYRFMLAENSTFDEVLVDTVTSDNFFTLNSPLEEGTIYHWRVQSRKGEITANWSSVWSFSTATTTNISNTGDVPIAVTLQQNYPNPFNPSTLIRFAIPENMHVRLEVYNTLGQLIQTLINENMGSGWQEVTFHAEQLPSGVYIYRLQAGDVSISKRLMLIK